MVQAELQVVADTTQATQVVPLVKSPTLTQAALHEAVLEAAHNTQVEVAFKLYNHD